MPRSEYRRKLTFSEARRHFIYIQRKCFSIFPRPGEPFTILVGTKKARATTDRLNRIWVTSFLGLLPRFRRGDVVVLTKNADGSFTLNIEY